MNPCASHRVLVIDDNPSIHEDFRKILSAASPDSFALQQKAALLFGESRPTACANHSFEVETAFGGEEGLQVVLQAHREGRPFALAFVDIRMPPGIDGMETIGRIWSVDPDIQTVICSAYSDFTARDILTRFGISNRLLMLRKPCEVAEILLVATMLCHKWSLAQQTVSEIRPGVARALCAANL